ncbi:Long-chain-alcohol oxidase [Trema orientale]|uniref:(R)-mandelonitrile lyase n=1 Tax=Trema orientale TaxID=63057 RepID=A0A2P5EZT1_TREOI|nr:Long-chain-alcohol oxidase [Trema orientale]
MAQASLSLLILLIAFTGFHRQLQVLSSEYDFSYMKSVYNATYLPPEEEYDYIVIGGGTAGCPLAATLSEEYSVLVLERGNAPKAHPSVLHASGSLANLMREEEEDVDDGDTPAQRFTSEDGVANVRGRVLGGSSMINAGFFSRADNEFFSKSGVEWDLDEVEKAYEWVEESIVSRPDLSAWQSVVKEALLEAGVGPDNGVNLKHELGTKVSGSTFDEMGRRHGAVELLNKGDLKNLRVAIHATVERIIFSTKTANPSAIGVIYTDSKGESHKASIRQNGEIILSAGAVGSPQLLLLSGIGPHSYLSSLNIPIVHSQPNVGKFMADNPRNNINLVIPFPYIPSTARVVGITNDYFIESASINLPFSPTSLPFGFLPTPSSPLELSLAVIAEKIVGPLSRGSLRLASKTDVKATPHVQFNYFTDPTDLSRCVSGMRKLGELLKTKSMDRFKYRDFNGARDFMFLGPTLPTNQSDDSSMEAFCQSSVTTIWHYHGGCLVGKVVDGDFKVIGTNSLRVVDGSTFTISPGTNPQATLMMIGRYVGLKILRERRELNYNGNSLSAIPQGQNYLGSHIKATCGQETVLSSCVCNGQ